MDVGSLLLAIWKLNALQLAIDLYSTIWLTLILFSHDINGLVQDCSNSLQSCTEPSILSSRNVPTACVISVFRNDRKWNNIFYISWNKFSTTSPGSTNAYVLVKYNNNWSDVNSLFIHSITMEPCVVWESPAPPIGEPDSHDIIIEK